MKKIAIAVGFLSLSFLVAGVTINVYFPAAAAEKAAERFVDDVLGDERQDSSLRMQPDGSSNIALMARVHVRDCFGSSAQAQQAEIEIITPQINAIKARMAQRQRSSLDGWFDAGAIGFTNNGLVEIRDRSAVDLSERRKLEAAVADENRDRKAVYREIAIANGHPEWEKEIQETFSRQWIANARRGWYYQDSSGSWRQK